MRPGSHALLVVRPGAGRKRDTSDERDRGVVRAPCQRAPPQVELDVPETGSLVGVPGEWEPVGGGTLDPERVAEKARAGSVLEVEQAMPHVDEAVEDAASAVAKRHAETAIQVGSQPPSNGGSDGQRLAVDEEKPLARGFSWNVLCPGERVGPENRHVQRPGSLRGRVGRDCPQSEARLGQQLLVSNVERPASGLRAASVRRGAGLCPRGSRRGRNADEDTEREQACFEEAGGRLQEARISRS